MYSETIYDDSYIKTEVKIFSDVVKTLKYQKKKVKYARIACVSVDSVLKVNKKYFPQVYLEQCKYKVKMREIKSFIHDYKIDLDSDD